jgi:hypothetical protein
MRVLLKYKEGLNEIHMISGPKDLSGHEFFPEHIRIQELQFEPSTTRFFTFVETNPKGIPVYREIEELPPTPPSGGL